MFLHDSSSSRHLASNGNMQGVTLFDGVDNVLVCVMFETLNVVMLVKGLMESECDFQGLLFIVGVQARNVGW